MSARPEYPFEMAIEGATPPSEEPDAAHRRVIVVLAVLSVGTGATDALSFLRLGNVFASVMTGNLVLLGVSIGRRDPSLAIHAGVAFAGYVAGVAVGHRICRADADMAGWARSARIALAGELVLLTAMLVSWIAVGAVPPKGLEFTLLAVATGVMGVQSAVVRAMPASTPSTTYLTGTLTQVVSDLVTGGRLAGQSRALASIGGVVAGAGATAGLVVGAPDAAPAVAVAAVALALWVVTLRAP